VAAVSPSGSPAGEVGFTGNLRERDVEPQSGGFFEAKKSAPRSLRDKLSQPTLPAKNALMEQLQLLIPVQRVVHDDVNALVVDLGNDVHHGVTEDRRGDSSTLVRGWTLKRRCVRLVGDALR
jgi:hypothetical protein